MRILIILITTLFIFDHQILASTIKKADADLISALSEFSSVNKKPNGRCQEPVQNYSLKKMSSAKVDPSFKQFSGSFCLQVFEACKKATGNFACAPQFSEKAGRQNNFDDIAKQAADLHQRSLKSNEVLSACCKTNQECKNTLKKTTFAIGKGHTDEFFHGSMKITLNSETISRCSNLECLEEIYYHELGHACQAAIVASSPKVSVSLPLDSCTQRSIPLLKTYKQYFGEKRVEDYRYELRLQMSKKNYNICPDQWFDEGMASIIFSRFMKTPLHFQRTCQSFGDDIHPEMANLIQFMDFSK